MDTNLVFHLPGEEVALELLRQLLPSWDPLPDDITQWFIQDALDRVQLTQLLDSSNLRDLARLNTQSRCQHAHAWLQAIPQPNLGLSMTSSEFAIALRFGWELPCSIVATINLVCVAPLWTNMETTSWDVARAHSAFAAMMHYAISCIIPSLRTTLQFGERNTFVETAGNAQVISSTLTADGHPNYFDISVCNTLQPGNLNCASVNAGAAAVVG